MLLGNEEIARLADDGAISGAKAENIGPVSYDLTTNAFHVDSSARDAVSLEQAIRFSCHLPNACISPTMLLHGWG